MAQDQYQRHARANGLDDLHNEASDSQPPQQLLQLLQLLISSTESAGLLSSNPYDTSKKL
jgi:hypothetical protein